MRQSGPSSRWLAIPAVLGAAAAFLAPDTTGGAAAAAGCLAVGALAFFAGHTWGLVVASASHVVVAGRLWPLVAGGPQAFAEAGDVAAVASATVLVTMLPSLWLVAVLLPRLVVELAPSARARTRAIVTGALALALAAALIAPALTASRDGQAPATAGDVNARAAVAKTNR